MSDQARKLEEFLYAELTSHANETAWEVKKTEYGVRFSLDLNDQAEGVINLEIERGAPPQLRAYRQWGHQVVPMNQSLSSVFGLFRPGPKSIATRSTDLFFQKLAEKLPAAIVRRLPYDAILEREQKRLSFSLQFDSTIRDVLGDRWADTLDHCCRWTISNINNSHAVLNFFGVEGDIGTYRRQAGNSYPVLAEVMASFGPLASLIDSRQSFADMLSGILSLDGDPSVKSIKAVLGKLSGVALEFDNLQFGLTPTQFVRLLTTLPIDWIPRQTGKEADALVEIVDMCLPVIQLTGENLATLLSGAGGKWVDYAGRLVKAHAETRPPEGATEESFKELLDLTSNIKSDAERLPSSLVANLFVKHLDQKNLLPEIVRPSIVKWLLENKIPQPNVGRISPHLTLLEDVVRGYKSRILSPLMMQAAGPAGVGGIPLAFEELMVKRSGEFLLKGKSLPSILEMTKKFWNDLATFMALNTPDDLTEEEQAAERARVEDEERQREMDRIIAQRQAIEQERQQAVFKKLLDDLVSGKAAENDETAQLRSFFGLDDQPKTSIWAPFTPIVQSPNGIYIIPLITPEQLYDEGGPYRGGETHIDRNGVRCLDICVGASSYYSEKCIRNAANIFSFRKIVPAADGRRTYQRLACLETHLNGNGDLVNDQFRGAKNGAVPSEAKIAADWFFQALKQGSIPFNRQPKAFLKTETGFQQISKQNFGAAAQPREEMVNNRPNRLLEHEQDRDRRIQAAQGLISQNAGYAWNDRRILRTVLRAWAPLLPKSHRGLGLDQYQDLPDIKGLRKVIFPATENTFKIRRPIRL